MKKLIFILLLLVISAQADSLLVAAGVDVDDISAIKQSEPQLNFGGSWNMRIGTGYNPGDYEYRALFRFNILDDSIANHASAWGKACEGIDITFSSDNYGEGGTFLDSFIIIENNHIEAVALDTGTLGVGIRFTVRGELDSPVYNFTGAGNIIRNNYWGSNTTGIEFGKSDGGSASTVIISGDTIEFLVGYGIDSSAFNTYECGDWAGISKYNIVRDFTYLGGIEDTAIYWDPANAGDDMFYEKTIKVNVRGNNDSLIANATVRFYNKDSTYSDTGSTGSYGYIKDTVNYYYAAEAVADTSYSPFNIEVSVGSYTGDSVVTVEWNTGSIEITLDTIGTLPLAGGVDPETNNVLITGGIFRGATIR